MATAAAVDLHRWTRREYEHMVSSGVFHPTNRLELIDGEIYNMSPQSSRHATAIRLVEEALRRAYGSGFDVRVQLPMALDTSSEPEPDVAVVEGGPRDYLDAHPTTALLTVEVSDTSLAFDRTTKQAAYARNGVPEYWIVNLIDGVVEVYRQPDGSEYREVSELTPADRISPLAQPDRSIAARDLLP